MSVTKKKLDRALSVMTNYLPSLYGGYKNSSLFSYINNYCFFIGYPRSGHSLVGALLDAHPNIIISHEVDAFRYLNWHYSKNQLFQLILEKSKNDALRGRKSRKYSYFVPDQWQGRFSTIKTIGDKHGEGATLRIKHYPGLIDKLRDSVGTIKIIHVTRNPYDNITTMFNMAKRGHDLTQSIDYYFSLCETVSKIKKQLREDEFYELTHESFIENPRHHLQKLCIFLGVEPEEDYINACVNIVNESPRKTRKHIDWPNDLIELVGDKIKSYEFTTQYSYDD